MNRTPRELAREPLSDPQPESPDPHLSPSEPYREGHAPVYPEDPPQLNGAEAGSSDTGLERPTPVTSLRRHPRLSVLFCILGLALGGVATLVSPVTYTAESRIAVGGNDLSAQAMPGYALGSQELAASYARYVNNSAAQAGSNPRAGVSVAASPIPESNIIRVEGLAPTPAEAVTACQQAAEALVAQVNAIKAENDPEKVLAQVVQKSQVVAGIQQTVDDSSSAVDRLQATTGVSAPALDRAKAALLQARIDLAAASVQRDALSDRYRGLITESKTGVNLLEVRPAAIVKNDRSSTLQRDAVAGLGLGVLLALIAAVVIDRRRFARSEAGSGAPQA